MRVSGPRPVILTVDDDHGIHEAYRLIFEDQYELLSATDGPQALKILQSRPIDLMLLDLKMPGMDGLAVLEHARRLRPQLPVIIVSIMNTARDGWSAKELGAVDYLTRPWDPDHLEQKVREALGGVTSRPAIPGAAAPQVTIISAHLGFRAGLTALLSLQCRVDGAASLTVADVLRTRLADLVTMEGAVGVSGGLLANTWVTNNIFRWSPHSTGPGPHFHLPPPMRWHLPQEFRTWYHHSLAIVRQWFRR